MNHPPRAGYTLPVFACASAIATLQHLNQSEATITEVAVDLIAPVETVTIPIEQLATLPDGSVLAITRSDPGDNLDLTRHTPIWALTQLVPDQESSLQIEGGEGIGINTSTKDAAIYSYARNLLQTNLERHLTPGQKVRITIILPEGKQLALRTSNAAFGVVDGLSLLGTTGIAQPLSAPGQLDTFRTELIEKAKDYDSLVFCLGENGLDLSIQMGINGEQRLKTANWIGPLLVEAALQGVQRILLFGYHGKLIKLAGGIFHTHHHVADGRQEILAAIAANSGLPTERVQTILASPTAEAALQTLRQWDQDQTTDWVTQIYGSIAERIDRRAQKYVQKNCDRTITIGSILFDRQRQILVKSSEGSALLPWVC